MLLKRERDNKWKKKERRDRSSITKKKFGKQVSCQPLPLKGCQVMFNLRLRHSPSLSLNHFLLLLSIPCGYSIGVVVIILLLTLQLLITTDCCFFAGAVITVTAKVITIFIAESILWLLIVFMKTPERERKKKINVNLLCFFQLQKICRTEETEHPSNMFCSSEFYKENRATPPSHLN